MNYLGTNNVYVADTEILTSGPSIALGAEKIQTGGDITEYLMHEDGVNKGNANFNSTSYVAFINVELDSALGTGEDLTTDGTSSIVRSKRDLYIYNTVNGTITRMTAGAEMTKYLNDDNTMGEDYRLIDILTGTGGTTSDRVKETVLGGAGAADFEWNDAVLEIDQSLQKLYNADGLEISGVALNNYFDENGNYIGGLYKTAQATAEDEVFASVNAQGYQNLLAAGAAPSTIGKYITQSSQQIAAGLEFNLHVGAQSDRKNKISATIETLTSAGLGVDKLSSVNIGIVDETGNNATDAIDVIDTALQRISTQRSALGAVQNRLEHTVKNLDNIVENTTAAEAAIRDTDMAEEMVRYANSNILQQAGQAMLAQANQANEGVLSLLQ
ncbi:MAG: flagellin [Lachnospiraceae bacterium]|nr:flagellin [Lachnospiraceae bacterium]